MKCGLQSQSSLQDVPVGWRNALADEGFRLFFPLAAIYAAVWPVLWVLALGFDLPLAHTVPPSLWHAHEMLVGAFGAALIGFVTTAAPEWTDTEPLRGRKLWMLAGLWGVGRVIGLLGWDGMGAVGAVADLAWLGLLLAYLLRLSLVRGTDRLLGFAFWIAVLAGCAAMARIAFVVRDIRLATLAVHLIGFAFLGLLGIALGRITVPVTNLVLDPTEATSPFRPHPGRMNLASGLVLVTMTSEVAGLSPAVTGYLLIAAGAAFMDRVAEAFIGGPALRAEILMLAGASALAGTGLILSGAARLGAPWTEIAGLHAAFMGGLGLGVYGVFCVAGLLHTGRPLGVPRLARLGAICLFASVVLRLSPDFGIELPGPFHGLASLAWATAFMLWLAAYGPFLTRIELSERDVGATHDLLKEVPSQTGPSQSPKKAAIE
ncbi:NnrS family protein [Microbaculum marinum]|uniref:NnrS family protein n=1 Tax=Microbaculum marinum TaxID=1764581 RepID=A0AAW9RN68_9HYPH